MSESHKSNRSPPHNIRLELARRDAAAHWVVRCDRGLDQREAEEFEAWCAADPRNPVALEDARTNWLALDRFPPSLVPPRRKYTGWLPLGLAAGLVVWLVASWSNSPIPEPQQPVKTWIASDMAKTVVLPDRSRVTLNTGTVVLVRYTAKERTLRLLRGEAHFAVMKDSARPFVVRAADAHVRAVGTEFNVHLKSEGLDVLVTEGRVQMERINSPGTAAVPVEGIPTLAAGHKVTLAWDNSSLGFSTNFAIIDSAETTRLLSWKDALLSLGGATLGEVAKEFTRRTGHRIVFGDPSLEALRMGGYFDAKDVAGFLHVLDASFGLEAQPRGTDETVLTRKR